MARITLDGTTPKRCARVHTFGQSRIVITGNQHQVPVKPAMALKSFRMVRSDTV